MERERDRVSDKLNSEETCKLSLTACIAQAAWACRALPDRPVGLANYVKAFPLRARRKGTVREKKILWHSSALAQPRDLKRQVSFQFWAELEMLFFQSCVLWSLIKLVCWLNNVQATC